MQILKSRKRFLIYSLLVLILMILAMYILKVFGSYQSNAYLNAEIEKAVLLLEEEKLDFSIDLNGLVPSEKPYVYYFSIANYNDSKKSNVDLEYGISMRTTTNIPLEYQLYRNEDYDAEGSVNLLENYNEVQDEDGSWYKVFNLDDKYNFSYKTKNKDIYCLVVYFPKIYYKNLDYTNLIDHVEITVDAKQIVD